MTAPHECRHCHRPSASFETRLCWWHTLKTLWTRSAPSGNGPPDLTPDEVKVEVARFNRLQREAGRTWGAHD